MSRANGPIFIGGLSYSGKTPLRIILAAHPDLSLTRKTYLWDRYYGRFGDLRDPRALDRCLRTLEADRSLAALSIDPDAVRRGFASGPATYARLFGALHGQAAARLGTRRWGEQLGFVERYADRIFADFPEARMIHMIRDPRQRLAAMLDAQRPRPGQLGWETAKWGRSAELAMRNQVRHPDGYRVVSYATLVDDSEATVRALCAFIGEDYVSEIAEEVDRFGREHTRRHDRRAVPKRLWIAAGRPTGSA